MSEFKIYKYQALEVIKLLLILAEVFYLILLIFHKKLLC